MKAQPTQSRKGVKGQLPLAGSRDSVPCGVWGNAPTVPRPTNPKEVANKGAGSEASLPVTLRVRRRAPKLLFPQDSVKKPIIYATLFQFETRQRILILQRVSRLRARQGGNENRRMSAVAPSTPSQCTPMLLDFLCCLEERKVHKLKNFQYQSSNIRRGTEGFQRANGKPFGRSRRSEIPCNK